MIESPIEGDVVAALLAMLPDADVVPYATIDSMRLFARHSVGGVLVAVQVPAGRYRADIMIAGRGGVVCVECDGASFHSTDEQTNRDAVRDAWFMGQGVRTMRFSGRRITRDVFRCAEEIVAAVGAEPVTRDGLMSSAAVIDRIMDAAAQRRRVEWQGSTSRRMTGDRDE